MFEVHGDCIHCEELKHYITHLFIILKRKKIKPMKQFQNS